MKKLLPILIGLSLTGFSAMSQAENLMQVYQQARLSNPDFVNPLLTVMPHSKKLTKPAAHYCHSSALVLIMNTPMVSVIRMASTPAKPVVLCN